ncbi:flavin reductase family protein [Novosphingobium sp. Chol11]|uniref:flavin reductase family protein n=1 Tax=Novosphingobium sp. Chol11 TaxID=1385763 RepID=UPI0025CD2BDE|nr:flavin reductase family protein [Novosphingobium sp. Chol11]
MDFDFSQTSGADRYKLMTASVTPRPIAWITSQSAAGQRNAAPFSFFNMMSADPPLLAIGLMRRGDGTHKDTAANILETGEFVVNLVGYGDAEAMNTTSIDAPPGIDEIEFANLQTTPSLAIAPPRIASAPVAMECRLSEKIEAGRTTIAVGEVLRFHIADRFISTERLHVDTLAMELVGRMHGAGWYSRSAELFQMARPAWPREA